MSEIMKMFEHEVLGRLRVVLRDGEAPWFVAKDIAAILGLETYHAPVARYVAVQDRLAVGKCALPHCQDIGYAGTTLINENGVLALTTVASFEAAQTFKAWFFGEVLPKLRKVYFYIPPEVAQKVFFADCVTTSEGSILLRGNGYPVGEYRLFAWLRANGYLIAKLGCDFNKPTQRAVELGVLELKQNINRTTNGHISIYFTTQVTPKGEQYFIRKFKEIYGAA
jgi:anti-repressor protein